MIPFLSRPLLPLPLSVAVLLLSETSSFSPSSLHPTRIAEASTLRGSQYHVALRASLSPLRISNDTLVPSEEAASMHQTSSLLTWNMTHAAQQLEELEELEAEIMVLPTSIASVPTLGDDFPLLASKRTKLKRELARAAITGFHPDATTDLSTTSSSVQNEGGLRTAECIMKELEQMTPLPIRRPAMHHSLNAHWSFVFTGVPTIGMRLITLLSRISVLFPFEILDFRDVALCVEDNQKEAKAIVEVQVCGVWEMLLEVCTSLRRPTHEDLENEYKEFQSEDGTLLLEQFKGIQLNGVEIPTPKNWHTTRTLEITYMDKDILIARTTGGEPHLLLRNSPLCYSPEEMMLHTTDEAMDEEIEECDIDGGNKWTEFFSEAIEIYGERITRCLVDRDFGREEFQKKEDMKNNRKGDDGWWKSLASGVNLGEQWGVGDD